MCISSPHVREGLPLVNNILTLFLGWEVLSVLGLSMEGNCLYSFCDEMH